MNSDNPIEASGDATPACLCADLMTHSIIYGGSWKSLLAGGCEKKGIRPSGRNESTKEVNNLCRNIRTLYNFEPPATAGEVRAAALQFVRKISGFTKPSEANEEVFNRAVDEIARTTSALLNSLVTSASPKDRVVESSKAHARALRRFGS